jgi:GxxExxY protein
VHLDKIITQKSVNDLAYRIAGSAIEVHKELGPGLLESVYEKVLKYELESRGLCVESQKQVPISYKGKSVDCELRPDLLVEELVVVEIKAVEIMIPLNQAQLLTYLKLLNKPKGLLINFNSNNITKALIPLVTEKFSNLPKE